MIKKYEKPLLGAHMSTEGGLYNAIIKGKEIECTVIQIFTKNNRQWKSKKLTKEEITQFHKAQKDFDIMTISHCSYLINLASPDNTIREKSVVALKEEIIRCNELSIPYAILHPGAKLNGEENQALKWIAQGIDEALESSNQSTCVLLETMAGQGTSLGHTFEQLAKILSLLRNNKNVGICIDTCHLFASGYRFSTKKDYDDLWKKFDQIIGIEKLKCIHLNDSKNECGKNVDRHEEIGKGKIGTEAFQFIMNDVALSNIPKIIETPKINDLSDLENLKKLKAFI